jgi:hypothetical protein
MSALNAADLLAAWERGLSQSPVERCLALLELADSGRPQERLAQLSIGKRDAKLLALREAIFGSKMVGLASCPSCGQQLEFNFDVADISLPCPAESAETSTLHLGDYKVEFRVPNSVDLTSLDQSADISSSTRRLLERCVVHAQKHDQEVPADDFPPELLEAISRMMTEHDPQADIQLGLTCPQCSYHWQAPLDIVSFLWSEIHNWASRMLDEVHTLASAYGWSEADILALGPMRRRAYLELIQQ